MNLPEISTRHDLLASRPFNPDMWEAIARQAHEDRGELIAEVRRLRGLCGRTAEWMEADNEKLTMWEVLAKHDAMLAELKEAAGK